MIIELTNLIPYPSMEGIGWRGSYSTDHAYVGAQSIKLTASSSVPEVVVRTTDNIKLNPSHRYYARVYGWQDIKSGRGVGFYWPMASPSFNDNILIGPAGTWNLYSAINTRESFSAGEYPFRLDYNNEYTAGTMYFDGAMLIDLTESFGIEDESIPDQSWIDQNIPYFNGKILVEYGPKIVSASLNPNPVNINNTTLLSVSVINEIIVLEPYYYCSGDIYSGEV